ncbi:MAG: HAMP domain-containing histidine kinase [Acidobacteriota bacterium]|nr:HAMP domain-containing histidine kinase [Acidobacteriota bacterium]
MRANQSSTALGKFGCFGVFTSTPSIHAGESRLCGEGSARLSGCGSQSCPTAIQGEGLLHDARNLLGAIGLYCDLLAMPGVLKPEHSQYPDELRLLGTRSGALIDALMRTVLTRQQSKEPCPAALTGAAQASVSETSADKPQKSKESRALPDSAKPVSLRAIVDHCSGLLRRVANGRILEVVFGPAAATPVRVPEEAVERILVNLVRNASAAMDRRESGNRPSGTIHLTLGMLTSRVGEARPWPFQRVNMSVEDCGCGMSAQQVEGLLGGGRECSHDSHGIGFGVVRELVAASDGDLRVMSAVDSGTRVQIEWPMASMSASELEDMGRAERVRLKPLSLPNAPSRRLGDNLPQTQMEGAC